MLLQTGSHLAISLVGLEVEAAVAFDLVRAAILGVATVAGERFAHHQIQHQIDQRGGEQDRKRPKHLVVGPGDAAGDKTEHDQPDAQLLGKSLRANRSVLGQTRQRSMRPPITAPAGTRSCRSIAGKPAPSSRP